MYPGDEPRDSFEKGWHRADMPEWEQRWAALPVPARQRFLNEVRIPPAHTTRVQPNRNDRFPEPTLQAWRQAGLIAAHDAKNFVVAPEARGFVNRLVTLHHARLLDPRGAGRLFNYADVAFSPFLLNQAIARIVQQSTGLGQYRLEGDPIATFVARRVWPDWVAAYLDDPLARPLLAAFEQAEHPVPLARVGELLPGEDPAAVRATLDRLVTHLALVEDLDSRSADILVGLLPEVAKLRRQKPEAKAVKLRPIDAKEIGPEAGFTVPDLRAFLLEIATLPPKLKQDGSLFQKEVARFLHALDPLPGWLLPVSGEQALDARLSNAHRWALEMEFVAAPARRTETKVLRLTELGQAWLTLDREAQFAALATHLREEAPAEAYWGWNDRAFLASSVTAVPARKGEREQSHWYGVMPDEEKRPLREALHRLFAELPVGTFHRVADVVAWGSEPARNPLLLGRSLREVVIRVGHRQLPPFEEAVEEAARKALELLLAERLLPLGGVQAARDAEGNILIARLPRLDVYFGKAAAAPAVPAQTRVIVQPDFTVIVIGLDAAPAAELAPFCDRQRGSASQGSLTFRLSRESVLRGIVAGVPIDEMLARLERLASKAVPANVVTELRAWAGQVRTVKVKTAIIFDCPDAATAGRVQQALGKRAERVGETGVAWPADEKLNASLRKKLQDQGLFVEGAAGAAGRGRPRGRSR
jgi:hypothetical protein